jgi:hypothetical protein
MHRSDFEDRPCKVDPQDIKELRFDGAYYRIDEYKNLLVYFFYNNCIQRRYGGDLDHYNPSAIAQSIQKMIDRFNAAGKKDDRYFNEGGYSIKNNQISIQSIVYIPQLWGTMTLKGTILNDSTIVISKYRFWNDDNFTNDSLYYRFIKTNKPDSLKGNIYKDKKWYWR